MDDDILDLPDNIEDPPPLIVPEHELSNDPDTIFEGEAAITPLASTPAGDSPRPAFPINNKDPSSSTKAEISASRLEAFIAEATLFKAHCPERSELPTRHMDGVELSVDPAKIFALPDTILEPERDVLTCDVIPSTALTSSDPPGDTSPPSKIRELEPSSRVAVLVISELPCRSPLPETILDATGATLASVLMPIDEAICRTPPREVDPPLRVITLDPSVTDVVFDICAEQLTELDTETTWEAVAFNVPESKLTDVDPSPRDAPTEISEVDSIEQLADNTLPIPACIVPEVCIVACP